MTNDIPVLVQRAEALHEQELRLLGLAVGDHLPYELGLRVAALRAERAALASCAWWPAPLVAC